MLYIISILISCSKTEDIIQEEIITTPKGYVSLLFDPQVEDHLEYETITKQASSNELKSEENNESIEYTDIQELGLVDFRGALKVEKSTLTNGSKKKLATINTPILRMSAGTRYMVLIYDENNNYLPELSKQLIAGGTTATTNNTIVLKAGTKYKYVAFSHNATSTIDPNSYTLTNHEQKLQTGNYDFMYTKGEINPLAYQPANPNNNPTRLNLIFERKLSKILVKYDIRGLHTFAQGAVPLAHQLSMQIVTSSTNQTNPFTKGIFDLKSGSFVSHSTYTNESDFNPVWTSAIGLNNNFNDYSVTTVYSSQPKNLDRLSLKFTKFNYHISANQLINTNISTTNPLILTIEKTIELAEGIGNSVLFEVIQPSVTLPTNTGITTKWAIANLFHRGWGTHNPYIMRSTNNGSASNVINDINYVDRFRYNDLLPEVYTNHWYTYLNQPLYKRPAVRAQVDSMGDPCLQVQPKGLWKTPTSTQLQELANYINNNYNTSWNISTGGGSTQKAIRLPSGENRPTLVSYINHNNLILNKVGFGSYDTETNSFTHYDYNNISGGITNGYYWSSDERKYLKISNYSATTMQAEILVSTNTNVTMSVRCVRK